MQFLDSNLKALGGDDGPPADAARYSKVQFCHADA
jgi:hypothetical protein